ncbi:MAG: hypothetical protein M1837_006605 [Sclerophora amabilis]|nr:MAG: hypothetical protein M1837_006605 [Sclerophora amabilis]
MATAAELQALLRFLSQDAKVPLTMAMGKIKDLQQAGLTNSDQISKADVSTLQSIFPDPKISKQITSAAKRLTKKRTASDASPSSSLGPGSKRKKQPSGLEPMTPAAIEESLALPETTAADEEELSKVVLHTNRAPLVLAFAVALLKHTMPEQPLSSRLSLAQAVVSANSKSKARSLGLEGGKSAEEEGWGQGQPKVKIMGREISVLKRWGYEWEEADHAPNQSGSGKGFDEKTENQANATSGHIIETEPALWGLDLEAFRSPNIPTSSSSSSSHPSTNGSRDLPIYTPQSARAYLLKSFGHVGPGSGPPSASSPNTTPKKQSRARMMEEKERNLGLLLHALDLLYASWSKTLSRAELDQRAWSWYVHVRPEIKEGVAGWGEKGEVRLAEILALRRKL